MTRVARQAPGGVVFHVLNRGVRRMRLFDKDGDYAAFEAVLEETLGALPMRVLAYCLMPNHWHLVLWPEGDGDLGRFLHRLTITHVRRWVEHRHQVGQGHVYQSRYKSFPVQEDEHLHWVLRYVERNALRAGLVARAVDWPWSSLWRSERGSVPARSILSGWPLERPANWAEVVDQPQTAAELEALRRCVKRGSPLGQADWVRQTAARLGLDSTLRPRGRPRKAVASHG